MIVKNLFKTIAMLPKISAIVLIKFYSFVLSPMKIALFGAHARCKFEPSCSEYALIAFKKHNFFYAFYLTIRRILRCNPFSKGGIDEVP